MPELMPAPSLIPIREAWRVNGLNRFKTRKSDGNRALVGLIDRTILFAHAENPKTLSILK